MCGYKRLHITPLSSKTLPAVLAPAILHQATNISFHSIQTFPEKSYGYVDLPEAAADKLKKKLHGSVLRGSKMRVEEARPKKVSGKIEQMDELETKTTRSKKARTREEGVLLGHELQDRKVKRGWTEPASGEAKPAKRSKDKVAKRSKAKPTSITGEVECLFKTTLPPNAAGTGPTKDGRVKKRKRGESSRDVVVHEFTNTTKHANFLRDESEKKGEKSVAEYIEGKGWVDEDGDIVEPEPKARRAKAKQEGKEVPKPLKPWSRRSSRLEAPSLQITASQARSGKKGPSVVDDETSSSGSSSSSDNDSQDKLPKAPASPLKTSSSRKGKQKKLGGPAMRTEDGEIEVGSVERLSITRSSASPSPVQNPGPTSAPANEVHPLEALFKRPNSAASRTPKKPALEVSTSFNFDPDAEEGGGQGLLMPQTPFTQQDIRQRRQRSAAPTPDTAAPGKTFGDIWEGTSDVSGGEDDMGLDDTPKGEANVATPEVKEEKPESEFSKWFWEHRGETNRAWKRRRREAAKEKRQKDNRERRG